MTHAFTHTLLRMVATGRCTLEDLDTPSQGWELNRRAAQRLVATHNVKPPVWHNSARAWVEAHPVEWQKLLELHAAEREQWLKSCRGAR